MQKAASVCACHLLSELPLWHWSATRECLRVKTQHLEKQKFFGELEKFVSRSRFSERDFVLPGLLKAFTGA